MSIIRGPNIHDFLFREFLQLVFRDFEARGPRQRDSQLEYFMISRNVGLLVGCVGIMLGCLLATKPQARTKTLIGNNLECSTTTTASKESWWRAGCKQ